jgi:16S rRNA processing protein RimM
MEKILLAEIIGAFGIKGWIKVKTYTQFPQDIIKYGTLETEKGLAVSVKIKKINGPNLVLAEIKECQSRTEAEGLIKTQLFANKENFPPPKDEEYYNVDLVGLKVVDETGKIYGTVLAVHDFGAGTFLDVEETGNPKIKTLPFQRESVLSVNLQEKILCANPDFLLE